MRKPYHWIMATLAALVAVYVWLCCFAVRQKPPLDFSADIEASARPDIEAWYASAKLEREPIELGELLFTIWHPRQPHQFRPHVGEGGIGGEGSIQVSYGPHVAVFSNTGQRWKLAFLASWAE